jgi:uncharacterized protein YkwD
MRGFIKFIMFLAVVLGIAYYAVSKMPAGLIKIDPIVNKITSGNELIKPGLKSGSTGDMVKILQAALSIDKDIYPSGLVTGFYGELTKSAVINFQTKHQLTQNGEVDNRTADKFNEVYGNEPQEYYLSLVPTPEVVEIQLDQPVEESGEWGKAKQIGEHTWTMQIGMDDAMATPSEIFEALNSYRRLHGRNTLSWDDKLASYALTRAQYFTQIGDLDEHAGFSEYLKDENNFKALGFWALGENSSYGYRLSGTHLIEWIYAGDKPHDDNQLNSDWSHVGIGVDGNQTNLIFGGQKI